MVVSMSVARSLALFAGLCVAWGVRGRAALFAAGLLAVLQPLLLAAAGGLWERSQIELAARDLRAWAVAAPLAALWLAVRTGRRRRQRAADDGEPDAGAASAPGRA